MSRIIKSSRVNVIKQPPKSVENKDEINLEDNKDNVENKDEEYDKIISIAKQQAEKILNDAMEEAGGIKDSVLTDAKKELEKIKKDSYEEGYNKGQDEGQSKGYEEGLEKGHEEGYNQGKDKSDMLIKEAEEIKEDYLNEKELVLNSLEENVIELVVDITKKILNQKIDENDESIVNLVLKGLESLNSKEDIRIRVSKDDFEKVESSKEEILAKVSLIESLKVDVDSNLGKGDCIIESSKGNVDVSVSTQMKIVEEELKSLLDSE